MESTVRELWPGVSVLVATGVTNKANAFILGAKFGHNPPNTNKYI